MKDSRKALRLTPARLAVVVCGCGLLVAAGCAPFEPDPPPEEFQLDVLVYGRGRVLLDPGGGTYEEGTLVALLAIEERNAFTLWDPDASGSDLITRVVVDRDKLVVALFEGDDAPSLSVNGKTGWKSSVSAFCELAPSPFRREVFPPRPPLYWLKFSLNWSCARSAPGLFSLLVISLRLFAVWPDVSDFAAALFPSADSESCKAAIDIESLVSPASESRCLVVS